MLHVPAIWQLLHLGNTSTAIDRTFMQVRAVTGGYFVAIMLVFLGSLVGLRLPGLFSNGPLSMVIHMVAAGLAAANLLVRQTDMTDASHTVLPQQAGAAVTAIQTPPTAVLARCSYHSSAGIEIAGQSQQLKFASASNLSSSW